MNRSSRIEEEARGTIAAIKDLERVTEASIACWRRGEFFLPEDAIVLIGHAVEAYSRLFVALNEAHSQYLKLKAEEDRRSRFSCSKMSADLVILCARLDASDDLAKALLEAIANVSLETEPSSPRSMT